MKTKQVLFTLITLIIMDLQVMAQSAGTTKNGGGRILVAYFSATGTTAAVAEKIAGMTHGDLYAIQPEKPYSAADLDWRNKKSRSSVEMENPDARPAIQGRKENIAAYDVVFIGYPIWWDLAPRVVNTFLEIHDLAGKTVVPFATSGGNTIANSVAVLKKTYPDLDWKDGKLLNNSSETVIRAWLDKLGIKI